MALIALLMVIGSYGIAEVSKKKREKGADIAVGDNGDKQDLGKTVYDAKCANCHGPAGNNGMPGVKDLTVTGLSKDEIKSVVRNGKGNMLPVELTDDQLDAVADYVQTLKK
jgi:cytochrome c550